MHKHSVVDRSTAEVRTDVTYHDHDQSNDHNPQIRRLTIVCKPYCALLTPQGCAANQEQVRMGIWHLETNGPQAITELEADRMFGCKDCARLNPALRPEAQTWAEVLKDQVVDQAWMAIRSLEIADGLTQDDIAAAEAAAVRRRQAQKHRMRVYRYRMKMAELEKQRVMRHGDESTQDRLQCTPAHPH